MMMKSIRLVLFVLLVASVAPANVPAPFSSGEAAFEPSGLDGFSKIRESIAIDMSALENGGDVSVENKFELEHGTAEREITLVMPAAASVAFELDGAPVTVSKGEAPQGFKLPWEMPRQTYTADGKSIGYGLYNRTPASFKIAIPGGRHTLIIRQKLTPSRNVSDRPIKYWQFSFVLLRPDDRSSISSTDVEIKTPAFWETGLTPSFPGESGVYKGVIRGSIPLALLITTKMPMPENFESVGWFADYALIGALFVYPVIGLILCWFFFSNMPRWAFYGVIFSLSWSALTVVAAYFSQFAASLTIPESQQANYGYGDIGGVLLMLFLGVVTLMLGFPLWLVTRLLALRIIRE